MPDNQPLTMSELGHPSHFIINFGCKGNMYCLKKFLDSIFRFSALFNSLLTFSNLFKICLIRSFLPFYLSVSLLFYYICTE